MDFETVFLQHIARSWDKQKTLGELIKDSPRWDFDMEMGVLSFAGSYGFKVQLLGSESTRSETWMWAWANKASNIPPNLLKSALAVRKFGEINQVEALTKPQFPLGEKINGATLAMVACGICRANGLYRGPYEGGAMLLLIQDNDYPRRTYDPIQRIAHIFPQLIATVPFSDHRTALYHYCQSYGLAVQSEPQELVALAKDGAALQATFDAQGRLSSLKTTFNDKQ